MLTEQQLKEIFKKRFQKLIYHTPRIKGMSQIDIAREMDISTQSLTDYLSKAKFPDTINYIKIIKFFKSKIANFDEDYLIGDSNSVELTTKTLIPSVELSEELIEQLRPYLSNQEELETLLSIPHMDRLAHDLTLIKEELEANIENIIDKWPEIKSRYEKSPYIALQKIFRYDGSLLKDVAKCSLDINDEIELSPYTLIRIILKDLMNQKALREKRENIRDLDSFLEKNAGRLKFSITSRVNHYFETYKKAKR